MKLVQEALRVQGKTCFYSTYEELKPRNLQILLWRIRTVFTVPMRNWNWCSWLQKRKRMDSFYSTYEELKLFILCHHPPQTWLFLQYLWGIETSINHSFTYDVSNRFYSTYEELKLAVFNASLNANSCFTVPMRNWNIHVFILIFYTSLCFYSTYEELKHVLVKHKQWSSIWFLQYLWGIETLVSPGLQCHQLSVFTVPMRNWNLICVDTSTSSFSSFYSTYEELKPILCLTISWETPRFYSTYEELKPDRIGTISASNAGFYSTYEELKPATAKYAGIVGNGFYSTYEELKLLSRGRLLNKFTCFYSTYEELKHYATDYAWIIIIIVFTVPMRNWNTTIYFYNLSFLDEFLQYLWGIETGGYIRSNYLLI